MSKPMRENGLEKCKTLSFFSCYTIVDRKTFTLHFVNPFFGLVEKEKSNSIKSMGIVDQFHVKEC